MKFTSDYCLIFDLDGTLVDSEALCKQAFVDLLPTITESIDDLVNRYRGRKFLDILNDLEKRYTLELTSDFEFRYRERVSELIEAFLEPIEGVVDMLQALSMARCIASSGPRSKIEQSLRVSKLDKFFAKNTFSSYEVDSWKPDPGLLLHASARMGFGPNKCLVVDDSEVGIEAAKAAGMMALHFRPQCAEIKAGEFSHMSQLVGQLP